VVSDAAPESVHGACNLAVNNQGALGISWLDKIVSEHQYDKVYKMGDLVINEYHETYDLRFIASVDGGESFLKPARVSSQTSKPKSGHAGRFFPGSDYMFMDSAGDGAFHPLWPDSRTGIFQLHTAKVTIKP